MVMAMPKGDGGSQNSIAKLRKANLQKRAQREGFAIASRWLVALGRIHSNVLQYWRIDRTQFESRQSHAAQRWQARLAALPDCQHRFMASGRQPHVRRERDAAAP